MSRTNEANVKEGTQNKGPWLLSLLPILSLYGLFFPSLTQSHSCLELPDGPGNQIRVEIFKCSKALEISVV
ncbi:hypothetical protein GQ457_11G010280 [Hibiscus cannabinus]